MDDLPPLVYADPSYPDPGYPDGFGDNQRQGTPWPATPAGGHLWHANQPASEAGSWMPQQAQSQTDWRTTPQILPMNNLPQFPAQIPMSGMPSWPQGFGQPTIMTTPRFMPTHPIQDAGQGDDWVHIEQEPEWRKERALGTPRPRSRSASHRAPSPFSPESSPSSRSSHSIGRSRSYLDRIREDDKRPPRDWRLDFSMTRQNAFGAALGQLLSPKTRRVRSPSIREFGPKTTLHSWLRYSSVPLMTLDVRDNTDGLRFRDLHRPVNEWDLTRFTCEPPIPSMRLFSDYFPWYIEVETSNPTGITMYDLFRAIWISMQTQISHEDYHNCEMDERVRAQVADAYARRCQGEQAELSMGIRRVDFLMERIILEGFVKSRDGYYEMKLKRPS
ncbi:hypothetical protein EUX98_g7986 [Antrodiella citrinella]|uniref:DUF6699 domain-containing protein n=1 Tax=Antrodiella citrinella TaxID=2447956 RepID=A0A4S4MCP0_9APHY|nr:hypothetical protein EUX98_g7986 [Antrodiella citrinella]